MNNTVVCENVNMLKANHQKKRTQARILKKKKNEATNENSERDTECERKKKLNNVNCVQFVSIEQFAFYRFFASVSVCVSVCGQTRDVLVILLVFFFGSQICAL